MNRVTSFTVWRTRDSGSSVPEETRCIRHSRKLFHVLARPSAIMCSHGYFSHQLCPASEWEADRKRFWENSKGPTDQAAVIIWASDKPQEIFNRTWSKPLLRDFFQSREFQDWRKNGQDPNVYEEVWLRFSLQWIKSRTLAQLQPVKKALRDIRNSQREKWWEDADPGWAWHQLGDWRPMSLRERQAVGLARAEFSEEYGGEWASYWRCALAEEGFQARVHDWSANKGKGMFAAELRRRMGGDEVTGFNSSGKGPAPRKEEPPAWVFSGSSKTGYSKKIKQFYKHLKVNRAGLAEGVDSKLTVLCLYLYYRVLADASEIAAWLGKDQRAIENLITSRKKRADLYFKKLARKSSQKP